MDINPKVVHKKHYDQLGNVVKESFYMIGPLRDTFDEAEADLLIFLKKEIQLDVN